MQEPLPLGIAAGVYKKASDIPIELLDTVTFVTPGSFTNSYNHGNRDLPVTELYDPETEASKNAKGLPNDGLPHFWETEIDALIDLFDGHLAELRPSLSPRKEGELGHMRAFLMENERWRQIDEIEVNLACPNHRDADGLHPVLARDPQAVNDRLKEWGGYPGDWAVKIAPDTPESVLGELVDVIATFTPTRIVSANTRLSDGELAGKRLSVEKGGQGGKPLLEAGLQQIGILSRLLQPHGIKLDACGGITNAEAARRYQEQGADRGQMATVPYFLGPKAVANIIASQHFG